MSRFLIYGANGYTGRLIATEALRQDLEPVLAGRNAAALEAMGRELGLKWRAFDLSDPGAVQREFDGFPLVLNCAGPFSETAKPVLDACLAARSHYLDITGEIDVFALCHRHHDAAAERGIVVAPGTGFDVVPTDCVAAQLKARLPDATHLVLAFEAGGGPSPGTAKTSVEGLAKGGRARIDGELATVPLAWKSRTFRRDGEARTAMTIPWGDVYTAYISTGIPNIETYMTVPPATIARVRRLRLLRPLLGLAPVQSWLKRRAGARPGPSADRRERSDCRVWGEARNARGDEAKLEIAAPNGYALTATASVGMVRRLLSAGARGGFYTPSQLMGADYVMTLPGVRRIGD
ncbi:MAG TPA: saccharopine dehydrogenase NADP-binding domain-containing protein [Tahibacter sp.]|uniref:saccharopine dehydrogenase family protein n=1 Tax=Tahibacter sp. TaxID=2056211 RepID=UPI002C5D5747|nr:saccharopine dehydrogenase NADP-binding domain-containing protein [Tahibacter sp.]HSX58833.1 saccharopine dehydrogenase NADP-binding domain-containing protein [Tahibacter sp.]